MTHSTTFMPSQANADACPRYEYHGIANAQHHDARNTPLESAQPQTLHPTLSEDSTDFESIDFGQEDDTLLDALEINASRATRRTTSRDDAPKTRAHALVTRSIVAVVVAAATLGGFAWFNHQTEQHHLAQRENAENEIQQIKDVQADIQHRHAQAQAALWLVSATSYTVSYRDASGNDLKGPTTTCSKVGEQIRVEAPDIDGYQLTSDQRSVSLTLAKNNKPIVFTYAKVVPYTVRYLEKGTSTKVKKNKTVKNQLSGEKITEKAPSISGYALSSKSKKSLKLTDNGKQNVITFYYTKAKAKSNLSDSYQSDESNGTSSKSSDSSESSQSTGSSKTQGSTKPSDPLAEFEAARATD